MDEPIATPAAILRPKMLWLMRGLAIAGLAIAAFLAFFDVWYLIDAIRTKVPYCSWAPRWFDCDTVIFHAKWSNWLGIPVAAIAVPLYLAIVGGLFTARLDPARSQRRLWLLLHTAAIAVLGAAAWFVWVQVVELKTICQYCMAEHAIGALLALLIVRHARRIVPRGRSMGTLIALAGVAVLIVGQILAAPPVVRKVVIGTVTDDQRYVEPDATLRVADGLAELNVGAHLLIGSPDAKHVIIEAIDFTCPRCKVFFEMLDQALAKLGPDYAVLVLTYPLSHTCNEHQEDTEQRHRIACELATLAHAVWLTDPAKYPDFHSWLFENQDRIAPTDAIDHARKLVDPSRLDGYRADPDGDPSRLVRRDVDVGYRLMTGGNPKNIPSLPGVFLGDSRFTYLPDSPDELVSIIRQVVGR